MRILPALLLLWTAPALAQPADCAARPVGPAMPMDVRVGIAGTPGLPPGNKGSAELSLGDAAANGTVCAADTHLPVDILHGDPAPHGLLRGNGPHDVLHNHPWGTVTIEALPPPKPSAQR